MNGENMIIQTIRKIASLCNIKKLARIADIEYQRLIMALKKEPRKLTIMEYQALLKIYKHFKEMFYENN